jgi:hypothetical protein
MQGPEVIAQPPEFKSSVKGQVGTVTTNYLAISCTSCNCEHCFSSARWTITDDQNRLSGSIIEALQLQKNWLRRSVVKSHVMDLAKQVAGLTKTTTFGLSGSDIVSFFSSLQKIILSQ